MQTPQHTPVLLSQALELLAPRPNESYLDLTAGYGGHAAAVAERTHGPMVLVDRDQSAVDYLHGQFSSARIMHMDFLTAVKKLIDESFLADMVLLDIGVSAPQFDDSTRGFSFREAAPLDMRMDRRQSLTAADIVNSYPEAELADIIWRYGEERYSRRIANALVRARPLKTTTATAEVIARAVGHRGRIHPATRSFQALRIETNKELEQLEQVLPLLPELLNPGGRLVVISFHSLEDRLVKHFIKEQAAGPEAVLVNLTKKPLSGRTLDVTNPRARSAKLRAAMKINTKNNRR